MAQFPFKTWNALRGDSVFPLCLIALGVVSAAFSAVRGGTSSGSDVLAIAACLSVATLGFLPLAFVARHVSSDESGCFHFRTLIREVVADPETILSVRRLWFIEWPYPRPVIVTTTTQRILVTQWIERRPELRAALLAANPQMKIGSQTLTYDL